MAITLERRLSGRHKAQELEPHIIPMSISYMKFVLNEKFHYEEHYGIQIRELTQEIHEFYKMHLHGFQFFADYDIVKENAMYLLDLVRIVKGFEVRAKYIFKELKAMDPSLSKQPCDALDDIKKALTPQVDLIFQVREWVIFSETLLNGPRENIDYEVIEKEMDQALRKFRGLRKWFRGLIKKQLLERWTFQYDGILDSPEEKLWPGPIKLLNAVLESIRTLKLSGPIIKILTNRNMVRRHWMEISSICGVTLDNFKGMSIQHLIDLGITEFLEKIEPYSTAATREAALKKMLDEMLLDWQHVVFNVNFSTRIIKSPARGEVLLRKSATKGEVQPFICRRDKFVPLKKSYYKTKGKVRSLEEIQLILDDHLGKALGMKGSAFVRPYKDEVCNWYEKLVYINQMLDDWGKVQIQWMYFSPIFSSPDIIRQMPTEGALFEVCYNITVSYVQLIEMVKENPSVLLMSENKFREKCINEALKQLDIVTDGVNAYLEEKRLYFARNTPNYIVRLETGREPVRMKVIKKMINLWTKLEFMPEERLPKLCFNRLKTLDKEKPDIDFNWVSQFRAIAELNAFAEELSIHHTNGLLRYKDDFLEKAHFSA
ncbi:unnamed protein product [Nezara viridula]|uniref:Dynein heavy chain linker domain-containing protein n=1 Tax=Nezara viridula TaxID=85310 RepID=A0A9P0E8W4_NEZVI|nr:unnamed protein product [Nezara viridula]